MINLAISHIVLMRLKSQVSNVLTEYFEDRGVPTVMHTDGAKSIHARMLAEDLISTWRYPADLYRSSQSLAESSRSWDLRAQDTRS